MIDFFKTDIFDLNYQFTDEKVGNLYLSDEANPQKGIITRILSLLKHCFLSIPFKIKKHKISKNSVLFFAYSSNELKSMVPIQTSIEGSCLVGQNKYKNDFPLFISHLLAIFFIPLVFVRFIFCNDPYLKKSFHYIFNGFCLAYAFSITLPLWLKTIKPKKIIISNQLSVYHRSLAKSAYRLDIETVFMQHASVTENFPSLKNYHIAILEGEDSLHKYQKNGSKNIKIFLAGVAKSDEYFYKINKNNTVKNIGICSNELDNIIEFDKLISQICLMPNLKNIYLRPHPTDRRFDEWKAVAIKYRINFSNVRILNSFDFLSNVDLIISGNSNIHLEAISLNVLSVFFDSINNKYDHYGFIKNGLVDYFSDINSVTTRIKECTIEKKNNRNLAKKYIETIDTAFDGKSTQLFAKIINDIDVKDYFTHNIDENNNLIYKLNK